MASLAVNQMASIKTSETGIAAIDGMRLNFHENVQPIPAKVFGL
jgi:hypothetical protein